MLDTVHRAVRARPEVKAELWRRGMFNAQEKAEIIEHSSGERLPRSPLGSVRLATLLAQGDTQLAARAVLRDVLDAGELRWLDRLLRFQKPNGKRDELARIVERALEGRKGNVRRREARRTNPD